MRILFKTFSILAIALNIAHALDPMYNYRYNLVPEILVPDALHYGLGTWTYLNEDLTGVANVQIGLSNDFEAGLKFLLGTNDYWVTEGEKTTSHDPYDLLPIINIGAKYAIHQYMSLQLDVPMAINEKMKWSGIVTLTTYEAFARNVSFIYEARMGFGAVAGEDSYVKPALGGSFYFQIVDAFRVSFGAVTSCSIGKYKDFKDDLMLDILPRVEAGFTSFRLMGEVAMPIVTLDAQKHYRFALFVMQDL